MLSYCVSLRSELRIAMSITIFFSKAIERFERTNSQNVYCICCDKILDGLHHRQSWGIQHVYYFRTRFVVLGQTYHSVVWNVHYMIYKIYYLLINKVIIKSHNIQIDEELILNLRLFTTMGNALLFRHCIAFFSLCNISQIPFFRLLTDFVCLYTYEF